MDGGGPESIACSEREPWMFCRRSDIAWSCLCSELCVMSTIKALLQLMFVHTLSFIYIYFFYLFIFLRRVQRITATWNHVVFPPPPFSPSLFLHFPIMCFHFHFFAPYMQTLCVGRHSLSPSVFPGIPAPVSRLLQPLSPPLWWWEV